MTVNGVQENDSQIQNEEHDHVNLAKRIVPINSLISVAYDYIGVAYPSGTQEVYTFKTGGSSGTTVATITVNYSDSTKNNITNVARS